MERILIYPQDGAGNDAPTGHKKRKRYKKMAQGGSIYYKYCIWKHKGE